MEDIAEVLEESLLWLLVCKWGFPAEELVHQFPRALNPTNPSDRSGECSKPYPSEPASEIPEVVYSLRCVLWMR